MMEQYQDIWVQGKRESKGVRECESRYEMIAGVARLFNRPFTVLDIGANLGYFSLRLAEDFDCTVLALEGHYSSWLREVLDKNGNDRVISVSRTATLDDLRTLADVEHFDLTLALSVTHHVGASYSDVLRQVRRMGMTTILELPTERNACGQVSVQQTFIPEDGEVMGYGKSHLGGKERPLVLVEDSKTRLERAYWNTPMNDCDVEVQADYDRKVKLQRGVESEWHRGINLQTWLSMGPSWPSKAAVLEKVAAARPTEKHGDLRPHNVILQGDSAVFVDAMDPRRSVTSDEAGWNEIVGVLS
ncbi:MAG TPA: class I SAM-dependent methyltransferase [Acidimicrobiia bacterium]